VFVSLFRCQQDYEKTAGPICMKFSGKVWEWPLDDLITFLVNSEKPRDAAMHNTGTGFVVLSRHSLLISKLRCSSWPHVQSRSVAASDDTWQIEMKCVFPGPTSTRYCSFFCLADLRCYICAALGDAQEEEAQTKQVSCLRFRTRIPSGESYRRRRQRQGGTFPQNSEKNVFLANIM